MFEENYFKDLEGVDITNVEEEELYGTQEIRAFDSDDKKLYIFTPKGGNPENFSESDVILEGEESAKKNKSCMHCK